MGVMDEFAFGEGEPLRALLIDRAREEGGITFREFMELALYHPRYGYYCQSRPPMGRHGDYVTSPEVSPIFGALLGRQLYEMWQVMGAPCPFQVVEAGAGPGTLARDILAWARHARPDLLAAMAYCLMERSPSLREQQRRLLEATGLLERAEWWDDLPPDSVQGCLLCNELLDSFPVHRVFVRGGRLWEVYVVWDGEGFREELRPPSTPALEEYFRRLGLLPGEGCYAEVNLEALAWVQRAARALRRGFLLALDYGYEAPELYAPWRQQGTLLCFYQHQPCDDPYLRPGRQDMTAHVDITSIVRAGQEAGLELVGVTSQARFLQRLGIDEALAVPGLSLRERLARRRAAVELTDPAGLGRLSVLVLRKGLPPCSLRGLEEGEDAP
jgi:SAM-dependent MidA family methyltransferase